jgi:hypothetical protein
MSALPTLASVLFIRIVEFGRRPVAEQARLRAQLEAALSVALIGIAPDSRIILDAPDGIAIAMLRDPAGALQIAQRCMQVTGAGVPLAMAVNHGAVRLLPDSAGQQGLIGDAIGTASAIARFAGPSRLFVSRSFRDALAEAAPGAAAGLKPAGVFTDANVRTHELLGPDDKAAKNRRRQFLATAVTAMFATGAAAVYFRQDVRQRLIPDRTATVAFDIHPEGDVFVDGFFSGRTPPLSELQLPPGIHTIDVRRRGYPAHTTEVSLEAGGYATIRHAFEPRRQRRWLRRALDSIRR